MNLVYLSNFFGLSEVANFWESVVYLNKWHQHRISKVIVKKLFGTLSGKKIAILGFAFKANTNDTRESAAIQICKDLLDEGANLLIHDPKVTPKQIAHDLGIEPCENLLNNNQIKLLEITGSWNFIDDYSQSFFNTDAAVILTEWDCYSQINWKKAASTMRKPSWIFDTRSTVNSKKVLEAGLNLWKIGDGFRK